MAKAGLSAGAVECKTHNFTIFFIQFGDRAGLEKKQSYKGFYVGVQQLFKSPPVKDLSNIFSLLRIIEIPILGIRELLKYILLFIVTF